MFSSSFLPQYDPHAYQVYNIDEDPEEPSTSSTPPPEENPAAFSFIPYSQALTAHNRRMILPYKRPLKEPHTLDDPLVVYRFFEFFCATCNQAWLSPLYRAREGLFCRICHQFCGPRGMRHSLTPYLGRETCYGKYFCHVCHRGFSSYKSQSNCPEPCFQCGTLVFPYYQIAHSTLHRKIQRKDAGYLTDFEVPPAPLQPERRTRSGVRKITSGILPVKANKKRLHGGNTTKVAKRNLKTCYSEPTLGVN